MKANEAVGDVNAMIQAEVGGGARIDTEAGVQRPGFMIRDFMLPSSRGDAVRISQFRGQSNLLVMFGGCSDDAMRVFFEDVRRHLSELYAENAVVLVVVPYGPGERSVAMAGDSPILVLYDERQSVHLLSGAADANGRPVPLVYLTDRFGEIVSVYSAPKHAMRPAVEEVLNTLEFINHQCPECEPPEWPR